MIVKRYMGRLALIFAVIIAGAVHAAAQITTGTVSGTIKDAQGGVIPGATVVLISETQGHQVRSRGHQRDGRLRVSQRHG